MRFFPNWKIFSSEKKFWPPNQSMCKPWICQITNLTLKVKNSEKKAADGHHLWTTPYKRATTFPNNSIQSESNNFVVHNSNVDRPLISFDSSFFHFKFVSSQQEGTTNFTFKYMKKAAYNGSILLQLFYLCYINRKHIDGTKNIIIQRIIKFLPDRISEMLNVFFILSSFPYETRPSSRGNSRNVKIWKQERIFFYLCHKNELSLFFLNLLHGGWSENNFFQKRNVFAVMHYI